MGKLPVVKQWLPDTVHYESDVVTYEGGTFQAIRDTGRAPGSIDWVVLARPGSDGRSVMVRGTFDATQYYRQLDVVALNGGSFIAKMDGPGSCPGTGWQLICSQGKAGKEGPRGVAGKDGERGDAGPSGRAAAVIVGWKIDRDKYLAFPQMSDGGEGPALELRGMFEQFHREAR
jgi:hypothetical protein